jgi:hypothetical protein
MGMSKGDSMTMTHEKIKHNKRSGSTSTSNSNSRPFSRRSKSTPPMRLTPWTRCVSIVDWNPYSFHASSTVDNPVLYTAMGER